MYNSHISSKPSASGQGLLCGLLRRGGVFGAHHVARSSALVVALVLSAALCAAAVSAQTLKTLPPKVLQALQKAQVPAEAMSLLVVDAEGTLPPRLSHRAEVAVNPASVMKLVTTLAALDLLGPQFTWKTPVYVDGSISASGTLNGSVYIQGRGDPKLVMERIWLLVRRLQGLGIRHIQGDLVLDRSLFDLPPTDPGDFDGERLRPYNVAPDALLLNYASMVMTFVPDPAAQVARLQVDPPLAGVLTPATVPLAASPASVVSSAAAQSNMQRSECVDYRAALQADFSDPNRVRFLGRYPAGCGERVWPVAYADPASFAARAFEGMWRASGGQLSGTVREGKLPAHLSRSAPTWESVSPALSEVVRDINKYSNNVMAQQLLLTLGLQLKDKGSLAAGREVLAEWWTQRWGAQDQPIVDNGSGLSRRERISAAALARMLQWAWQSPLMPELVSSLPIAGVDGTLKTRPGRANANLGSAHLKTGSLRDVVAIAGYVHGSSIGSHTGKRWVLVAVINHPQANAARAALDAALEWAQQP